MVPPMVPVARGRLSTLARGVGAPAVPRPVPRPEAPASPPGPSSPGHVASSCWPRSSPRSGSTGPTWPVLPATPLQRLQRLHRQLLFKVFFSKVLGLLTFSPKRHTPLLSHQEHQIHRISSLNHPNPLCFGESKEKTPIYIFTEAICISPSFC
jgi:hypothetical protein